MEPDEVEQKPMSAESARRAGYSQAMRETARHTANLQSRLDAATQTIEQLLLREKRLAQTYRETASLYAEDAYERARSGLARVDHFPELGRNVGEGR